MVPGGVTELVLPADHYRSLRQHLFPGDGDEHSAVVLAGIDERSSTLRLLAREVHLVAPEDFPPGDFGYRQTAPRVVGELGVRAATEGLSYVAIHSHPGPGHRTALSRDDIKGHERLFPHLLDLTHGRPVAGVALAHASAAGEVWRTKGDRRPINSVRVVGPKLERLESDRQEPRGTEPRFDRQARLFGTEGQAMLRDLHVAVVGAGGGGSILVEQLAHLGVGTITIIDFDVVKEINLSRIVGCRPTDTGRKKVAVLKRLVTGIDPRIQCCAVDGDITDLATAEKLLDADFIFLATDTINSRLVFNAVIHRYLIPGVQIGAKVDVAPGGNIAQVYMAVRPVLPTSGCLYCNSLIDPMQLQREARTDEEERAQNYVGEQGVVDPSVISLNGVVAASAVNVLLFAVTTLSEDALWDHRVFLPRSGEVLTVRTKKLANCPFCSLEPSSMLGMGGEPAALPCRRRGTFAELDAAPAGQEATRRSWLRFVTAWSR